MIRTNDLKHSLFKLNIYSKSFILTYAKIKEKEHVLRWLMLIQEDLSIQEKLEISLSDAAKYDVACTSSGVDRKGKAGMLGNTVAAGLCHSFAGRRKMHFSLKKILFTNQCIYDCKYCINRCSNDVVRTSFTPDEVSTLTMEFYRRELH